VIDH